VDGDGDLDIFYASEEDDAISLLENQRITEVPEASFTRFAFGPGQVSFDGTGVSISFAQNTAGSGNVTVSRLNSPPTGRNGIPQDATVSSYRTIINAESGLTFGVGTQVRFDASQFDGINVPEDVDVYARPSVNFGTFSLLATEYIGETNEIAATVTGFSEFVFVSNNANNPLPVELTSFTASLEGEAVALAWSTATETNNAGFDVERSTDGETFTTIGFEPGVGTTEEAQSYRFVDREAPFATTLLYRLRQVDTDGTFEYSPVVEVEVAPSAVALLPVAPNPVVGFVNLRYELPEATAVRLQVFDLLGRRVATLADGEKPAGRHEVTWTGSRLAPGTYFVRLQAGSTAQTQMLRLVR
jgi:hypothetical protein